MTPLRLSHTWTRRLYVGLFSLALIYIILYMLQSFSTVVIPVALQVGIIGAAGAVVVAIASGVLFFFVQKISSFIPSFATYMVFLIITALLVQQTGGISSYFLPIWTLLVFFAALFGAYGWLPVIVMIGSYTAGIYLGGELTVQSVVIIVLSSLIPLIAGMIIWRDAGGVEDPSEKNVKNLASQLSEVANRSEIVINAIGDGVIAIDGQGIVQLINPAAQQILGWGKQDALMLSYKSILKLADENNKEIGNDRDPIQQVLNTNQQTRGNKLTAVTESGKKINVALVVSPIGDPGSGVIAVFRDVTNERAEEREQAEFISTASHEMRTPVASIEGYLGLALNPNTATIDQRARDFILKAHEAAQHLGRLFQDLLDVSKSEDGRMTNAPKVVDVVKLTETIAQGLTQKATDKGLELIFAPNSAEGSQRKIMPVYFVNQDNDHIREILDNLIDNAIKYTPQGSVVVDITGTDEKVVVSVKDSGLGIPPEDVPHLFQKFYRVNNIDRQSIGGTGLGLYLARRLAEAMQGRLWVESVFQKGSTFFLELPRITTQEAEHLKQEQATQAAQSVPTEPQPAGVPGVSPIAPTQIPVQFMDTPPVAPQPAPLTPAQPVETVQPAQAPVPVAPASAPATAAPAPATSVAASRTAVRPATSVPRGESLTREQIAERVRQLEELAKQQRTNAAPPTGRQ